HLQAGEVRRPACKPVRRRALLGGNARRRSGGCRLPGRAHVPVSEVSNGCRPQGRPTFIRKDQAMSKHHALGLAVAIAMTLCTVAQVADVSPLVMPQQAPEEVNDWYSASSSYFWGASLSGKTSQFGLPTFKIDSDFSD